MINKFWIFYLLVEFISLVDVQNELIYCDQLEIETLWLLFYADFKYHNYFFQKNFKVRYNREIEFKKIFRRKKVTLTAAGVEIYPKETFDEY